MRPTHMRDARLMITDELSIFFSSNEKLDEAHGTPVVFAEELDEFDPRRSSTLQVPGDLGLPGTPPPQKAGLAICSAF